MKDSFSAFRTLSMRAYIFWFGSIWGFTTFGYKIPYADGRTPDTGLLFVWIVCALIGSTLIGIKNHTIVNPQVKWRVSSADFAVIITLLAISFTLPLYLGLVRSGIILLIESIYISIYFNYLFKGKIVPLDS